MQLFVKLLTGKMITLDASEQNTVREIMSMIEAKEGMPEPCQRLIFAGKQLEIDRTLADYKVGKESTLQLVGRMAGELYIKWQGAYLMRKDYPGCFHNFWHDLTGNNRFKRRLNEKGEIYEVHTCENLTVYHLKKIVAKFLCLETHEIAISLPDHPSASLSNSTLMEKVLTRVFIASLADTLFPASSVAVAAATAAAQ